MSTTARRPGPARRARGAGRVGRARDLTSLAGTRRLGLLERAAPTREAWIGHEEGMGAEPVELLGIAHVAPVGLHDPALRLVLEVGRHDLLEHLLVHGLVLDRYQCFDAPIQI